MASNNMYRVGDFVYFESSATAPYQIRRIDELNKTSTGAVEAKVACYFRRRDVSIALINQAEKYYVNDTDSDEDSTPEQPNGRSTKRPAGGSASLSDAGKHRIKHRELFLSRQTELLPATHIRGKCSVTLYNDAEPLSNYLAREDAFYYKLVYDPVSKTLQEDRGAMRIGADHQSDIQPLLKPSETDPRFSAELEQLMWKPGAIADADADLFCTLARAVGTLGRSYDSRSTVRQPLLLDAAACAGRDITRQHAHNLLHQANYDLGKACQLLLPNGQPVICRDQLEDWSANETHLFEDALDKHSKVFPDILSEYLSWKTPKALIELYYYWKTTDRYVRQRRTKMATQEHRLKQVYIPNYCKPNPSVLYTGPDKTGRGCEGCAATTSAQWYVWGPQNLYYRLCTSCWNYWKRYGGLRNSNTKDRVSQRNQHSALASPTVLDAKPTGIMGPHTHPSSVTSSGSGGGGSTPVRITDGLPVPGGTPSGPARAGTQCFKTPGLIRLARILCPQLVRPVRLARRPGKPASTTADKRGQGRNAVGEAAAQTVADSSPTGSNSVSFSSLRSAVQPILNRIADPSSLLHRPLPTRSVNDVILALATRKGINLTAPPTIQLHSGARAMTNGPTGVSAKRPRPPSPSDAPSHEAVTKMNGVEPPISQADSAGDLFNGSKSRLAADGGGGPPCKRPALVVDASALSPVSSEASNGLVIADGDAATDAQGCS